MLPLSVSYDVGHEISPKWENYRSCFPKQSTYTGYMHIQSGNRPPFKRRYFCLKNNFLLSDRSPCSVEIERIISLDGVKILTGARKQSFEITTETKTYYFKCSSSAECKLWVEHLDKASRLKLEDIYKIGRILGRSESMDSKVVAAVHKVTGNHVAIKIINKDHCDLNRLYTEVQALKRIKRHDCVVELLDIFETWKYLHLIMELCEGGELLERASKGDREPFDEIECCRIIHQVAKGVKHIHSHAIVHRDLKPANILYKDKTSKSIRVADFGISKVLEGDETHMRSQIGTIFYLAPEVLKDQLYDKRVDYWSIGVIMHLLLSGKLPFQGERATEIIQSIVTDNVNLDTKEWANVSHPVKDLVKKLLSRDAGKRGTLDDILKVTAQQISSHESSTFTSKNLCQTRAKPMDRRYSPPEISIPKRSKSLSEQGEFVKTNICEIKEELEESQGSKPDAKALSSPSTDDSVIEIKALTKPTKRMRCTYIPTLIMKTLNLENNNRRQSLTKKMANNWSSGLLEESDTSSREITRHGKNKGRKRNPMLSALMDEQVSSIKLWDFDLDCEVLDYDTDVDEKADIKPITWSMASINRDSFRSNSLIPLVKPKTPPSPRELSPARLLSRFAKNTCEKSKQCTTSFSDRIKALKIKVPISEFCCNIPKHVKNQGSIIAFSPVDRDR